MPADFLDTEKVMTLDNPKTRGEYPTVSELKKLFDIHMVKMTQKNPENSSIPYGIIYYPLAEVQPITIPVSFPSVFPPAAVKPFPGWRLPLTTP